MSYITKNIQGPVTTNNCAIVKDKSYITKNIQGPVTDRSILYTVPSSYITKNIQGPVTLFFIKIIKCCHILLKIYRVL